MKRYRKLFIGVAGFCVLCAAVWAGQLLLVATGTPVKNAAFVMKFERPCSNYMILNNRTGQVVYYRFNDSVTTPTASATIYDVCLDNLESQVISNHLLKENPVQNIGVFCVDTTPTSSRIVGY